MNPLGGAEAWQVLLILVQALIALAGFVGALMIGRLIKAIDNLSTEDAALHARITAHREDVLANYVRHDQIESVRKDLIGRVDRFELALTKMFSDHEKRESDTINEIKQWLNTVTNRRRNE